MSESERDHIEYETLEYCLVTAMQVPSVKGALLIVIKEDEDGDLNYWHDMDSDDADTEDLMVGMAAGHLETLIQNKTADLDVLFECDLDEFLGEDGEEEG